MIKSTRSLFMFFILLNSFIFIFSLLYVIAFRLSSESDLPVFRCVFHDAFHLYCPGCGGSRSVDALFRLDLVKSFLYYPAILYTCGVIAFCDAVMLQAIVKRDISITRKIKPIIFILIPIIVMIHFFVRNILLVFFGIDSLNDLIVYWR